MIVFALTLSANSQSDQDYLIKQNGDTISCIIGNISESGGNVVGIKYTDTEGNEVKIKGKSECEKFKTIVTNGAIFDLVPLKASQPDGYKRHIWRKIDGKVKVYEYSNTITNGVPGEWSSTATVTIYMVKLENGKFYDINKSNFEKVLKPHFMHCKKFTEAYKGEYSSKQPIFEAIVKLYNELCNE